MYCTGQEKIFFMSGRSASPLGFLVWEWPWGLESGGDGEIDSCTLEIQAQICEFCFLASQLTQCPDSFCSYFVLVWISVRSRFLGAPELLVHPICSTGITAFCHHMGFWGVYGNAVICINLCALRMRQWRAQTFLRIVSNQIRVLIHLKMRPILEGKKTTKKKIKQEEAVFCFYCMLLLSPPCQEKPTGTNSCLFICCFYSFRLQNWTRSPAESDGCKKNAWWEYWSGVLQSQPAWRLLLINWLGSGWKTCFPYLWLNISSVCLIN